MILPSLIEIWNHVIFVTVNNFFLANKFQIYVPVVILDSSLIEAWRLLCKFDCTSHCLLPLATHARAYVPIYLDTGDAGSRILVVIQPAPGRTSLSETELAKLLIHRSSF